MLCTASPRDSLSELREYTEGLGEPTEADDGAPPSGQSVISLLSSEELEKLIEEVKVLDEPTLKVGVCDGSFPGQQLGYAVWPPPQARGKAAGRVDASPGWA